ncbi:MAG: hypothetical protein DRQ55_12060 [Planctomycetota bacterium]|nr:MAG: hypothetical protein DRQ55_12060 [Planctomycetota bacterium]
MTSRLASLALVAAVCIPAAASAQTLVILPDNSWATDITPDGRIVVGTQGSDSFYWDWKNDAAPTIVPDGYAVAVSDDGLKLVGVFKDPAGDDVAGMWTAATGWVSLGYLPNAGSCPGKSRANDISGDGNVVVGSSWDGCSGRAFRWTAATGMQELQHLGNGSDRATCIAGDGVLIGGYGRGMVSTSTAFWVPDLSGAMIDPNVSGQALGLNNDGTLAVGTQYIGGNYNSAFYRVDNGPLVDIGSLNSTMSGRAQAVSDGGEMIVGYDAQGFGREAWVWTPASGILGLNALLPALGITGAPFMQVCNAVSADGNIVVGGVSNGLGGLPQAGFILAFNDTGSWNDLGHALAGALGDPNLTGSGDLLPLTPVSTSLSNALPGGSAWLLIGLSALNAPFKGGVLVPNGDMIVGPLGIDGAGELNLSSFWPSGVPSGFTTYFQYWIPDAAGVKGYAASNGLGATTP